VYLERRGTQSVVGHVWKGRVGNVLAGMEAAFIDVGLEKNGFLHVDEVVALGVPKNRRKIADLLKKGDEILVQATKDPMGTKGCRLTMQLSLAGRFAVYVPYGDGVGISKRLPDEERSRLRKLMRKNAPKKGGVIVRTAAAGVDEDSLARDLESLSRLWDALRARAEDAPTPTLLYSEADISLRVIRDLLNEQVDQVLVDDEEQYKRITAFLKRTSPTMARLVSHYTEDQPLMEKYGAEAAIRSTLERRANLPGGGYLIVDDTEAMTVIDVNSGRNVGRGGTRLEDTITKTNLEAAREVARQLRLRDIGGIVVIDFIDMDDKKNRDAVMNALEEALARDRTRTWVADISPLGLVQMTRQNRSDGPREVMGVECARCEAVGFHVSDETLAIWAERDLMKKLGDRANGAKKATIALNPRVASGLGDEDGDWLSEVEEAVGVAFNVKEDASLEPGTVKLVEVG
jgi:ribonuclease G